MTTTAIALSAAVLLSGLSTVIRPTDAFDDYDLAGSYCANRPGGCCRGRHDDCSAPIRGTLCYCDDFCNHTRSEDCCPDYWSFCKGVEPPPDVYQKPKKCNSNGQTYSLGETVNINCNECRCEESNGKMQMMCNSHECLIDPYLLDTLNYQANRLGWSARNYSELWGKRLDEGLALRLGALHSHRRVQQMPPVKTAISRNSLQRFFDGRVFWGKYISEPIDQGWCSASWAIATAQVITDRFAVMTKGAMKDTLSPQHLLSCNKLSQQGCNGGHLTRAWNWVRKFGLVAENCYPWQGGRMTECAIPKKQKEKTAPCPRSLDNNRWDTRTPLHRVGPVYRVATEEGIMQEIITSGPVQAVMKVTKDFFLYKSGVYKCSNIASGSRTGYHSVRIVGWGEEYHNGRLIKYWIVSNSWGRWWGEEGYFRIAKGTNECQIEDFVIAGWVYTEDFIITINPRGYDMFLQSNNV